MDQVRRLLAQFTLWQKVSLAAAIIAVGAGLMWVSQWRREQDFKPLFTALSAEDAGAIVARLKEGGVEYRLAENGSTVLVPSARLNELRLQMAGAGIPKTGRIGFELFDKTNFGLTEFAEQVNYHRAVEGELERSVMAIAEVESARVHITMAKESIFTDQRQPAKASVMVKLKPGKTMSPQNVAAITHLAASAVKDLAPEHVTVVDMRGALLSRPKQLNADGTEPPDAAIEYRQRVERDLLAKVNSTLEPLLGADKFRAGVSADVDFTSGELDEEVFDPNRSVMVNSQRVEESGGGRTVSGLPGTASNLPRPPAQPQVGSAGNTRRSENITYQTTRTVRRTKLPQGAVKRLSVSVLVGQKVRWQGYGDQAKPVFEPPAAETMKVIKDVVAGAVGLVPDRGDQLVVESLPFETNLPPPPEPPAKQPVGAPAAGVDQRTLVIGACVGGLLAALVLAGWLWRRQKRKKTVAIAAGSPAALPQPGAGAAPGATVETVPAIEAGENLEQQLTEQNAERERQLEVGIRNLKLPQVQTPRVLVLTKHMAAEAKKDPGAMAHLIRSWMQENR